MDLFLKNHLLNALAADNDSKKDPSVGFRTAIRIFCLTEANRREFLTANLFTSNFMRTNLPCINQK